MNVSYVLQIVDRFIVVKGKDFAGKALLLNAVVVVVSRQ